MSEFVRCTGGYTELAWTCVLAEGHEGAHIFSLWSDIAKVAEAKIQAVRELHPLTVDELDGPDGPEDVDHCQECGYIPLDGEMCPTIRVLDGERDARD